MDTNKIGTGRWKSADFRMKAVKRITDAFFARRGHFPELSLSEVVKSVERFEEKVNASAKSEGEYIAKVIAKVKAIYSQPQIEAKLLLPNPSGSGEVFSAPEAGEDTNEELQEQTYQKVQKLKSQYLRILNALHQNISNKLQEHESSPQESKTIDMERFKRVKKVLEYIFSLFRVSKSEITANTKGRVDLAEKHIQHILKNASSNQGKHSADVQSKHQFDPSRSRISPKNNMCLQEHQVARKIINSQQDINQPSFIKGPGNAVQQQTHFAQATEAFDVSINTPGISDSPFTKDGTNINEISHKLPLVSEEPSAAMQRLIKVLTSMSPEALSASVHEIAEVIRMSDAIPMLKWIEELPQMEQQETHPSLILEGREMSPSINTMPFDASRICASAFDGFNELTDAEEPYLNSVTSKLIDEPPQMELLETQPSLILEGWEMSNNINGMPFGTSRICASARDGFNQLTDAEEPDLNSVTSKFIDELSQMAQQQTQPNLILEGWKMLHNAMPFDTEEPDLNSVASKLIDEPPQMAQQQTQPNFISEGWKMSRSIDAMPFDASRICASACDGFNQLNSFTSKVKRPGIVENRNLLEEIKEINNLLIDSELAIGEKDNIESEAGVATEHNEGLVVKLLFNAVSVDQNLVSHFTANKKLLIKPLRLLVPTGYPLTSPVILDNLPLEVSEDLRDLSMRAKAKLRFYLQSLDQHWSLKVIARSWERCAREAIIEYAQAHGGGTFSSKYGGGWKVCRF